MSTPSEYPILQYFDAKHLPVVLQEVSDACGDVARLMAATLPPGPEVSAGLRDLLRAKDCFVRAALPLVVPSPPDVWNFYQDGQGEWRWSRRARNNEVVAAAHEGYARKEDCETNARRCGWRPQ